MSLIKYVHEDLLNTILSNYLTQDNIPNIVQMVIDSLAKWDGGEF